MVTVDQKILKNIPATVVPCGEKPYCTRHRKEFNIVKTVKSGWYGYNGDVVMNVTRLCVCKKCITEKREKYVTITKSKTIEMVCEK